MDNPLAAAVDALDPDASYTAAQIADILDLAYSSVISLHCAGWLPAGQLTRCGPGRGSFRWSGAALIAHAALTEEDLPPLDHDAYAPLTLYRWGCGCDTCLEAHNEYSRQWRQDRAEQAFTEPLQERLLALVADGTAIPEAASACGVSLGQVFGYARTGTDAGRRFGQLLHAARAGLCRGYGDVCGASGGYRRGCRGLACFEAQARYREPVSG